MSGLSSTLSIAKTALSAQQYGINVTGNNIANVNNEDYSIQNADHTTTASVFYNGYVLGTGVDVEQVEQTVDQLLENRLTDEQSTLAAYEEMASYLEILEGYFDESSDTSLASVLSDYWNTWHDLADNPLGSAERNLVYEQGNLLAERFNTIGTELDELANDLTNEISTGVNDINILAQEIANLNKEIINLEGNTATANDLRDQRNALIDELGELIDVDVITGEDGDVIINVANGAPLVNGVNYYSLVMDEGQVMWVGSTGYRLNITDDISGGKLAGWLNIRDETIPKYRAEIDELASEMIWAMNYQQSQGVGLTYYNGSLTGTYAVDDSGWLSSFSFGNKINYDGDTTVWVEDNSSAETAYRKIMIDMGISTASLSDWEGTTPGAGEVSYELTVVDEGDIGDKLVTESCAENLAKVWGTSSGGAVTVLDSILAEQTITVYGADVGTQTVKIADSGGDAIRSAASIAEALDALDGVAAYASSNSVEFDLSGISGAEDGDEVIYSLYVDGIVYEQSFIVDSGAGTPDEQFEDSLVEAVQALNELNGDTDLYADGLVLTSDKGATLGIQDFEIQDNAGIELDNFTNFDATDVVELTITTDGVPTTSTTISVDLTGVSDITDQDELSQVFYEAFAEALPEGTFTVELNTASESVIIRTIDGSNITLSGATDDTGNDATIDVANLAGTTSSGTGNSILEFDATGSDVETFNSDTSTADTLAFSMLSAATSMAGATAVVNEASYTGAGATTAAAIMGTVTILTDDGMGMQSTAKTAQGLFGSSGTAETGSSIMTLGGEGGFEDFTAGETISFDVDGQTVSFVVSTAAGGTTDYALATQLMTALGAVLSSEDYALVQNGCSVSIIKDSSLEDPIEITDFEETGSGDAVLAVSTGGGTGTEDPENGSLESGNEYKNFSTASLYDNEAIIYWQKKTKDGILTGESGLVTVTEEGRVEIVEGGGVTLTFEVADGSLVAGNTLTVNTDVNGEPDPLEFTVSKEGNSVNDIYYFEVVSGGTVGVEAAEDEEPLVIQWSNSVSSGRFILEGDDPPRTPESPIEVEVDGMTLSFYDGTLFTGDVFTVTTDESGVPVSSNGDGKATGETMSDWHWTLESFADQFNREASGLTASVTSGSQLKIEASHDYHVLENIQYSGQNGFSEDNITIEVLNWAALDFNANDLEFIRNANGEWGILSDATGGVAQLMPEGGDDDGFMVDLDGDGIGDLEINFAKAITGQGSVTFDLVSRDAADINFAFGDDESTDSGLLAAAGINTFFEGSDALTMEMNSVLQDINYIAAGVIDASTGKVTQGSNENAVAFTELQDTTLTMKQWTFTRGESATSSLTDTTLDSYYHTIVSSLGLEASNVYGSLEYAELMVNQLTDQRNTVSAVSLDEEMVNLIKYQQAFSAASKLLTTADDMLNTLLSIR